MTLFAKNADGTLKRISAVTRPASDTPRNPYATGYGIKIPSGTLALIAGKWQRVYVACFSNSGSAWVQVKGERVLLDEREPETSAELLTVDRDFARFLLGYQLSLLWSTSGSYKGQDLESLEGRPLSGEMARATADDCMAFYLANKSDIQEAAAHYGASNDPTGFEPAGHDFWLTRAGHGAGYWDGGLPKALGDRLTAASEKVGSVDPYVGNDGKVYQ